MQTSSTSQTRPAAWPWPQRAMVRLAHLRPHRVFLVLGILFGVLFLLITPPFMVPDGYSHFGRAYQVSQGIVYGERRQDSAGGYLPASVISFMQLTYNLPFQAQNKIDPQVLLAELHRPLEPHKLAYVDFRGSVVYSPIAYLPQVIGITLGRWLRLPPILVFYLGRLTNLLVWCALTALAIRLLPFFQWVFVLLALTPMSITLAGSHSADAFLNGLSFLLIALILHLALGPVERLERKHWVALLVLSLLIGFSKQIYLLLFGLYFMIPVRKVGSWKQYGLYLVLLLVAGAIPSTLWTTSVAHLRVPNEVHLDIQPGDQARLILERPARYLRVLYRSLWSSRGTLYELYVGVLGWADTILNPWVYRLFTIAALVTTLFSHTPNVHLQRRQRLLSGAVFFSSVLILTTVSYILWSGYAASNVNGLQGRYFIPLAPCLLIVFYNQRLNEWLRRLLPNADISKLLVPGFTTGSAAVILLLALHTLLHRFYPASSLLWLPF